LLNEQLRAKISDFGTAIIVQDLLDLGGLAGTETYMAPEQWRGEPLDARTDIYALGCQLTDVSDPGSNGQGAPRIYGQSAPHKEGGRRPANANKQQQHRHVLYGGRNCLRQA
jgi:serine/threonine protein kinase